MDGAPIGFGIRSKRYAMLLDNGVVKALHVEDKPGSAVESSAERLAKTYSVSPDAAAASSRHAL